MSIDLSDLMSVERSENKSSVPMGNEVAINRLDREAARNRSKFEVYKAYQDNISKTDTLVTEIVKGLKKGENIYCLFLKAVEALSLLTDTELTYTQAEADIMSIYGVGLLEPVALQIKIKSIEDRLKKLKESLSENGIGEKDKKRIEAAIKSHEEQITELRKREKSGE